VLGEDARAEEAQVHARASVVLVQRVEKLFSFSVFVRLCLFLVFGLYHS